MKVTMTCPKCGAQMNKRKYSRWHSGASCVYQFMCTAFPRCNHRIYVDALGEPTQKPKGNH
jgi:hypothetical protein